MKQKDFKKLLEEWEAYTKDISELLVAASL